METLIEDLKQALRMFRDGPAFTATAVIDVGAGLAAVCVPALRASRVDPTIALRDS
jgi:ABC-type lipoprotein release transport system permease subunit